ncbi:phytanoyl-CoA dioxygenase family protein [Cohnella terricola]|uniref:Phytanoyl-CoA dioxygenase family protein n=1 Tax=Cohnella terricola TaxID=1289167 RepID=A0A559J842_9BACL|nr:phytanoyl-CoA dioxygenase family protein [Cohnella terricola]TVX96059.1 phytanoyl-CoA dioxygenase family protein [Cohnella terricola]
METLPINDNNLKPISGSFQDSTPMLKNLAALRERAEADGMLYFKGLIPREDIVRVRLDILEILKKHSLTDPRRELIEGMADLDEVCRYSGQELLWNGVGVTLEIYREIQKLESFHALAHHNHLLSMYSGLFESEPFPHPRNIGRIMLPHPAARATPSHQDYLHIQGETETWTAWIPLGDVPQSVGGLAVLKGSHKSGLLGVSEAPGAGGLETILCGLNYEWETVDYEAGDVLTFNSLTVHKSMPNQVSGKIRMSCDFRFQALKPGVVIEPRSLLPHGPYTWEELYEGWQHKDLQYYWENVGFRYSEFDETIRWQKEKIC